MLTGKFPAPFYVKHFQHFHKGDWLFEKTAIFTGSSENFFCDEHRFFGHGVSGQ